jgi:hypothetical protein
LSAIAAPAGAAYLYIGIECVRSTELPSPNWSRPLPRPLKIPTVMTLKTLADVRELIGRHLPARCREQHIWRHVADQLAAAARGGSIDNVVVSLRLAVTVCPHG